MASPKHSIALLHFATPPVVGGVESVMGHHARLFADAGHTVRVLGGRGDTVDPRVPFVAIPHADSQHPEVLAAKQALDQGIVPPNFETLTATILASLNQALAGVDFLFAHNVLTMAKNVMLTAAVRLLLENNKSLRLIAWHHDIAATASRYQHEVHSGYPWNLLSAPWKDPGIVHVAVSEQRRKELLDLWNDSQVDVRVIASGVDPDRLHKYEEYTRQFSEQFALASANPLVLLPVRITRRKNLELALRITAALSALLPGATLVVTGPPGAHNASNRDYLEQLRTLRRELALEPPTGGINATDYPRGVAHFLSEFSQNYLPDPVVADFYQAADVLLMTSNDEGFGIPLIEAGLAKLPIFCSDIPPFHEIAGKHAQYFSLDDDPEAIAARIAQTL
ncbi:MAG: glycosyltransferase family 4 protein, partial [Bdellovibrionales bacterium]|nr:glycosyltransferase family 4 protein [Bdellovibrionales bacterium]